MTGWGPGMAQGSGLHDGGGVMQSWSLVAARSPFDFPQDERGDFGSLRAGYSGRMGMGRVRGSWE